MTLLYQIIGIGLLVAVSTQVLNKTGNGEQATLVSVGGLIVAVLLLLGGFGALIDTLRATFGL